MSKATRTLIITEIATGIVVVQCSHEDVSAEQEIQWSEIYPRNQYTWEVKHPTGTQVAVNVPVVVDSELSDEERNAAGAANLDDVKELKSIDQVDLQARLPVVELFHSIQGEGCMIGMPTTFIRLAGCDMKCAWCDSKETWYVPDIEKDMRTMVESYGHDMSDLEGTRARKLLGREWLTLEVLAGSCQENLVVITGGEPCIHPLLEDLAVAIKAIRGKETLVCIETNGAQATPPGIDWVVCSPKYPNDFKIHPECKWDELKYVVDENFSVDCVPEEVLDGRIPAGSVWLQPCDVRYAMSASETRMITREAEQVSLTKDQLSILEATEASWNKCYDLAMEHKCFRVGIQLHKFMGAR